MATRKTVVKKAKKPTAKKASGRKSTVKAKARVRKTPSAVETARTTTTSHVTTLFKTVPDPAVAISVPIGSVQLFVNGNSKGLVETGQKTMGEFTTDQATRFGVRSFSVYMDGVQADSSDASRPLDTIAKIEIVAKDTRG